MTRVDFYFDYLSGYAYFAWLRVQQICDARADVELRVHPVLFAALLDHWGQLGPAEIAPKRAWVYRDGFRYAAIHDIPMTGPRFHPFRPLTALRLSLPEVAGDDQRGVVQAIFHAGWGAGIDLGSPDELRAALDAAGFDGAAMVQRTQDPAVKTALRRSTERAIERGVFGVPTTIAGDELVWGSDRLDYLDLILDGNDPLDRDAVARALARPRQTDRRR